MTKATSTVIGVVLILGRFNLAPAVGKDESAEPQPFAVASVHFEQNATDGDVEVVFEVKGRSDGLAKLSVVAPDGRTVIDFAAPDGSTLGMRQFRFESPEPTDVDRLKSAYPEGVYDFSGATAAGARLHGRSALIHQLPRTTSFVRPRPNAESVDARNLEIVWSATSDAAAYVLEIEESGSDVSLEASLPKSATSFPVPSGFLGPNATVQLGIGTVSAEGNISFVETTFTTARGN